MNLKAPKNKKLIGLAAALTLACSQSWADWVDIGKNESGNFYIDTPSIQKSGDKVKMWYLVDFNTPQEDKSTKPFLSTKDQSEYDCKEERSRTIYYNNYSGKMGRGKILFTLKDPLKWRPVAPGSIAEVLLKIACGKK